MSTDRISAIITGVTVVRISSNLLSKTLSKNVYRRSSAGKFINVHSVCIVDKETIYFDAFLNNSFLHICCIRNQTN